MKRLVLVPAALVSLTACPDGGESSPLAFDRLHDETFLAIHVDLAGLRAIEAFQEFAESREFRDNYEAFSGSFRPLFGIDFDAVRCITLCFVDNGSNEPGSMLYLRGNGKEFDVPLEQADIVASSDGPAISYTVEQRGQYYLEVECWDDGGSGPVEFDGDLVGDGSLGAELARARKDRRTDLWGPVRAKRGEEIRVSAKNTELEFVLYLRRAPDPFTIGGAEVYDRWGGEGFVAQLENDLVLAGNHLVSGIGAGARGWRDAVEEALEVPAEDSELTAALRALDRSTLNAAFSWSAFPREQRYSMEDDLGRLLSKREARALREIEIATATVAWADGVSTEIEILCEDDGGAKEVEDLVEELLYRAEVAEEIPRSVEEIVERVQISRKRATVTLRLEMDENLLEDLLEDLADM